MKDMMAIPPEVTFDRFLRGQTEYKDGKQDLDRLDSPEMRSLLTVIQQTLNLALLNENRGIPEHREHAPFHLDYINSGISNAHAYPHADYSFIGLTMGLIDQLAVSCVRLSESDAITAHLYKEITPDVRKGLQAILLDNVLHFVVSHEFTHIVHGHAERRGAKSNSFNEIADDSAGGTFENQIMECDADGYAAYQVIANLIGTDRRVLAVSAFQASDKPVAYQDEVLLFCFTVAVAAFFFARTPVEIGKKDIYTLPYPPQVARLNYAMEHAIGWCKHNRPALTTWMTRDRFLSIARATAEAIWGANGGSAWNSQIAFCQSSAGLEYIRKLGEGIRSFAATS
jgi:hypothetical protein